MEYHIEVKSGKPLAWKLIASFDSNIDRDDCFDLLAEKYEDCAFRKIDD